MSIELNIPNISSLEKILNEALIKNEISTYGSNVIRFEDRLKTYWIMTI